MTQECYELVYCRNEKKTRELIGLAKNVNTQVCVWGTGKIGRGFGKELLDYLKIQVDYYCDRNESLVGKEIVDGIVCKSSKNLYDNINITVCFAMAGYSEIESVCKEILNNNVKYVVTYDDILELEEIKYHFFPFLKQERIAIYTCITGGYDDLREPKYIAPNCDYYFVSEEPPVADSVYKWIDLKEVVPADVTDPIYQNRYCKMHPHKLFPNYRYSIYLDGNFTITADIGQLVYRLKKARIGVIDDNYSRDFYTQAIRRIKMGGDTEENCMRQIKYYYNCGMPANVGSYHAAILIREHNNAICKKMMEEWWEQFNMFIRRDQASLPFIFWKNGFSRDDIFIIANELKCGSYIDNPYWQYERSHKKKDIPRGEQ